MIGFLNGQSISEGCHLIVLIMDPENIGGKVCRHSFDRIIRRPVPGFLVNEFIEFLSDTIIELKKTKKTVHGRNGFS